MENRSFSEIDILLIAREISRFLKNGKVKRITEIQRGYIIHFFRLDWWLVVVAHPHLTHIYVTETVPEPTSGHRFSPLLEGFNLVGVKVPKGERIIYLKFRKRAGTELLERILALEFTGRHANSCVVDGETGKILSVARKSKRLLVGGSYSPPSPSLKTVFNGDEALLKKAVPLLYREFLLKHGKFELQNWQMFLQQVISSPKPVVYFKGGEPLALSPIPLKVMAGSQECRFELYSQAVEAFYGASESPQDDKTERVRRRIMDELQKLSDYEKFRRWGEFILAHLNEIPPDADEIQLASETIPLDVADSPAEAADYYFELYKKKKRGFEKLMQKLKSLNTDESVKSKSKHRRDTKPSRPYLVFVSPNGFKVLVGKSAVGNELVTFGLASAHDLFFHVKGVPGAHVILKRDSGEINVPEEDIVFAARLALKHSKKSMDGKGDVLFTQRKYVKKPSGGKTGLVVVEKEEIIPVRLES